MPTHAVPADPGAWRSLATLLTVVLAGCGGGPPGSATGQEVSPPVGAGSLTPSLSGSPDGQALLSWMEPAEGMGESGTSTRKGIYRLRTARWSGSDWSSPETVTESSQFFVNWADFPAVRVLEDGSQVAVWLERGSEGGYDYGVRVASRSSSGWSAPWTPHEDDSPTEHGFVSVQTVGGGEYLLAWLDGRNTGGDGAHRGMMSLHARSADRSGPASPDQELDASTCDCCQTDMARTDEGMVIVYRDRTVAEIRDIAIVRQGPDGVWSDPTVIHEDGWEIAACPVNGPAVAAAGTRVAVAWFTAPADQRQVNVGLSDDAGRTFAPPIRVDDGNPIGRVDVLLGEDGTALVTWVEDLGDGAAEIRLRQLTPGQDVGAATTVARTASARASGFPRAVEIEGGVMVAWTDDEAGRVRAAVVPW